MNSDLVSLIAGNENKIVNLQRAVDSEAPMTTNPDMGGYRILNIAQPGGPSKRKDFESDLLTAKTLYDYMAKADLNFTRRDRDGSIDGRFNMSNHRISGLADPTAADDAVTRRYVASRFQALSDEVQDDTRNMDALQNLLGVVNYQVLIRESERIDTDIVYHGIIPTDGINALDFFFNFTLKENFMLYLLEEPVDTDTWLRIKQPGTYTIYSI